MQTCSHMHCYKSYRYIHMITCTHRYKSTCTHTSLWECAPEFQGKLYIQPSPHP